MSGDIYLTSNFKSAKIWTMFLFFKKGDTIQGGIFFKKIRYFWFRCFKWFKNCSLGCYDAKFDLFFHLNWFGKAVSWFRNCNHTLKERWNFEWLLATQRFSNFHAVENWPICSQHGFTNSEFLIPRIFDWSKLQKPV